jgi:hypothetical protein
MTNEEIIKKVKFALSNWANEDLYKASRGGAKMGTFILASCFIDYLSFYYSDLGEVKERYKEFVNRFMPQYNSEDLYISLRCKLVHNYTEGGKYMFVHEKPHLHLKEYNGRLIINLENFLSDVSKAREEYFKLVDSNDEFKNRLIKRFNEVGILGLVEIKL